MGSASLVRGKLLACRLLLSERRLRWPGDLIEIHKEFADNCTATRHPKREPSPAFSHAASQQTVV